MYQTLQTPERIGLTPEEATSRLTEKYAGLIGLTPFEMFSDSGLEVQREIDELWRGVNRAHFKSGNVEGSIDKHSLSPSGGSLPGLSLAVEVQTEDGPIIVDVFQNPTRKQFEILPPKPIEPIREDYATQHIEEGFDWRDIVNYFGGERPANPETPLYLVVFRSRRLPDADEDLLAEYDRRAHEAAKQSESLLYYFGGETDAEGNCLSFCLWSEMEAAKAVSGDPTHQAAAKLTGQMYKSFSVELFDVHKGDDGPVFVQYVTDENPEEKDSTEKAESSPEAANIATKLPRRDRRDPFVYLLQSVRYQEAA